MIPMKCERYKDIRQNTDYENWPEECWPCDLFTERSYPCRHCELRNERYREYLKESIIRSKRCKDDNIHNIIRACKKDGGKIVSFENVEFGMLVGATSTLEDYYWIFINENGLLRFTSCVGGYVLLDEIPEECKWLTDPKNEKKLLEITMKTINDKPNYDMLITPIYIKYKSE
ncbi:MAG: hypothetical protein J6D03_00675 [Clostridia bacterium]|nr:hypothetical protein [Clostridia bacterium]